MSYGLAYGLSAYGLSAQLKISTEEAKEQMDAYFARFGGVRDYLEGVVEQARKDGARPSTVLGRRRYLPELVRQQPPVAGGCRTGRAQRADPGQRRRHHQGRDDRGRPAAGEAGLKSRLLLQVHDELLPWRWPPANGRSWRNSSGIGWAGPIRLMPLEVSVGTGPTWDAAAH